MKMQSINIVKLTIYLENVIKKEDTVHMMRSSYTHLITLQVVEVEICPEIKNELSCQFIFHFVAQLKNLEKFTMYQRYGTMFLI